MKTTKLRSLIVALNLTILIQTNAQTTNDTVPSMIIGGIEVRGFEVNKETIRTVIYKSLVSSKKYVVNDRFDVAETIGEEKLINCMGKNCMTEIGRDIKADFAISAAYDWLGDRILISIKIVKTENGEIVKNEIGQFENQVPEINRMTDIMIYRILGIAIDENVEKMLCYKDNPAASSGPGKINNSGPRIGFGVAFGKNGDLFTRSEDEGGQAYVPVVFNIGYQLEAQYVGTENFSGLFEFIFNVGGLDQGMFIPSLSILHGARFGKNSWEIALGPSLSVKTLADVTDYNGRLTTRSELLGMNVQNTDEYKFQRIPDLRGERTFSTNFVIGVGQTFRTGAINIPVNAYLSLNKYGPSFGLSMGMNINKKRSSIQSRKFNGY